MKNTNANAQVYSLCLFDIARANKVELDVLYDLREIKSIAKNELRQLFAYPIISKKEKKEIIDCLAEEGVSEYIVNMLKLLVDFNHITLFGEIVSEYTDLVKDELKIKAIDVVFAKKPSDSNYAQIIKLLEEKLDSYIVINQIIDPAIVGGIIIKYDGKEIDNSVKKHLDEIVKTI